MEPGGQYSWAISVVLLAVAVFVYPPAGLLTNPMDVLLARNVAVVFLAALALGWSRIRIDVASRSIRHWIYAGIIMIIGLVLFLGQAYNDFGPTDLDPRLGYFVPLIVIGVALSEEFLFRGGWQTLLVGLVGTTKGIVVASLVFAAYHVPEYLAYGWWLWLPIGFVLLIGLGAGLLYVKTGNLVMSVALHSTFDFYGFNGLLSSGLYPPGANPADLAVFSLLIAAIIIVVALRNQLQPRKRKVVELSGNPDSHQ